jgi:hypothetical protein
VVRKGWVLQVSGVPSRLGGQGFGPRKFFPNFFVPKMASVGAFFSGFRMFGEEKLEKKTRNFCLGQKVVETWWKLFPVSSGFRRHQTFSPTRKIFPTVGFYGLLSGWEKFAFELSRFLKKWSFWPFCSTESHVIPQVSPKKSFGQVIIGTSDLKKSPTRDKMDNIYSNGNTRKISR